MRQLREVVGQRADIDGLLIFGPQPKAGSDQDGGVQLVQKLLLVGQLLQHLAAEGGPATVRGDAHVERRAADHLFFARDQDESVHGRQGRWQPRLRFLQAVGQVTQLFFGKLLLRGLVVVNVSQRQQAAGRVDHFAGALLVGGQEHEHVGVLAEALPVLLQDVADEFLRLFCQTFLRGPLVQIKDDKGQPWLIINCPIVARLRVAVDAELGVPD